MLKNKLIIILILGVVSTQFVIGQNNTNSPYTRFGYGDLNDNNSGEQRAMGGVAIGMRNKGSINVVNPASYSTVDSLTFTFDLGVSALGTRFTDPSGNKTSFNSNIDYLTMLIPLGRRLGFSAGLEPYSFSGYDFYSTGTLSLETYPDTVTYTDLYKSV